VDVNKNIKELNVSSKGELIQKIKEMIVRTCEIKNVKPETYRPMFHLLADPVRLSWIALMP